MHIAVRIRSACHFTPRLAADETLIYSMAGAGHPGDGGYSQLICLPPITKQDRVH